MSQEKPGEGRRSQEEPGGDRKARSYSLEPYSLGPYSASGNRFEIWTTTHCTVSLQSGSLPSGSSKSGGLQCLGQPI